MIEINFEAVSQIPGEDAHEYLNLPTSFKLSKEQVAKLIAIGPKPVAGSTSIPMYAQGAGRRGRGATPAGGMPDGRGYFSLMGDGTAGANKKMSEPLQKTFE